MAVAVIMPRQGQSVESCIITKWNKKVGDSVSVGDVLFAYETDKASFEEEAKVQGTLLAILAEEGDDIPCLENVCVIGAQGDDISAFTSGAKEETPAPTEATAAPASMAAPAPTATATASAAAAGERMKISPRAKGIAQNQMLDLSQAVPTGPNGRIIERDVLELSRKGVTIEEMTQLVSASANVAKGIDVSGGEFEDVKLSNIRKVIAKSMQQSLATMAQLTHSSSFDATQMLAYRKMIKEGGEALGLANITLNDIVIYAVSRVLKNHRDLNAHYLDDKMRIFDNVNIGMAVDTPRGLLVPTIFGADKMSLNEISIKAKELAKAAQEGTISPDYLTNGTFTISNLGSFGVEHFTPVINPPQTGILGVNNIQTKIKMVGGEMKPYQAMGLSLTYDHRALDGAPASRFLQELCKTLENFSILLAK
ncbi:MAG: dihydrolipoamide acetyltransferase family protein [Christensenellaceae bacterium]